MGKIASALLPAARPNRTVARADSRIEVAPAMGAGLVEIAVKQGWSPADLAKAVTREAARTGDISQLAAALASGPPSGLDPTMGSPFAQWDPNRLNAGQMGPGAPARPMPLGGEPRQFKYRVGWNFPSPPETDRGIDAALLRVLADSFDLVRLCIEIRKDEITQLEWDVVPREKNRKKREQWMEANADAVEQIRQFFQWPEAYITQDAAGHWVRRGKVKWQDWLSALMEDYFVGDWLTVWPEKLRNGNMQSLLRIDGSEVKPLLDLDGRIPNPPLPAYQTYQYGVPRASFTLEELIYRPHNVRNNTPYGFSHVEQMLVLINLALRFQMWTTQAYTDGALPLGLLTFPENYSPDQIEAVVETLNAAISGLSGSRQQFHGVPYGTDWKDIKPFDWDETFAQYIVEYTAAMFGLNAQKLGFMPGRGGQGLGGKGFAEQQSQDVQDKATVPDAKWVQSLMNELIERYFGRNDVEFVFTDLQDADEAAAIEADKAAVLAGRKSWDRMLEEAGEEPVGITEPFMEIGNTIWTVGDVRAAQDGEPRNPQLPALPEDEPLTPPPAPVVVAPQGGGDAGGPQPPAGSDASGKQPRVPGGAPVDASEPAAAGRPQPQEGRQGRAAPSRTTVPPEQASGGKSPANRARTTGSEEDEAEKFDTSSGMQPHGLVAPDPDELRRWKRMAVKAARDGRRIRPFVTDLIPDLVKTEIAAELADADSVEQVRAIFDRAIEKRFVTIDEAKAAGKGAPVVAGVCVRAADTGRILMLQRSIADDDDPARGTWEFPGGHVEDGESPLDGAIREWEEETGIELPSGTLAGSFRSGNGVYECFIHVVPSEDDVALNLGPDDRVVANPDDPDGDDAETLAWWAPSDAKENPALRQEAKDSTDWGMIGDAVPDAAFKLATVMGELAKAAAPRDDDTGREQEIKRLTAAGAAVLAAHAAASYGGRVAAGKRVDEVVDKLASHYGQAVMAGTRAAADAHGIPQLSGDRIRAIARVRAEAQRGAAGSLVDAAADGAVTARDIHLLARGAKPAYEQGYGETVTQAAPEAFAIWHVTASDPCDQCAPRDGQVFSAGELPGWPGDGDFGGDLCEGGPNDRCELEWRIQSGGGEDEE